MKFFKSVAPKHLFDLKRHDSEPHKIRPKHGVNAAGDVSKYGGTQNESLSARPGDTSYKSLLEGRVW